MRCFAVAVVAAFVTLAACSSTAPHTVGAAAINSGLALGSAAAQRHAGGCYAVCTNGTLCNPNTGLCEAQPRAEYCEEAPGGGLRCIPLQIGKEQERQQRPGSSLPVGVSPATGTVQPPPAEASPRGP
ncbi:MAG TPA: hypothetical protein VIW03_17490 [Anaeromyxobacter sp.]